MSESDDEPEGAVFSRAPWRPWTWGALLLPIVLVAGLPEGGGAGPTPFASGSPDHWEWLRRWGATTLVIGLALLLSLAWGLLLGESRVGGRLGRLVGVILSLPFWAATFLPVYAVAALVVATAASRWGVPLSGSLSGYAEAVAGPAWLTRIWPIVFPAVLLAIPASARISRRVAGWERGLSRTEWGSNALLGGGRKKRAFHRLPLRVSLKELMLRVSGVVPSLIGASLLLEGICGYRGLGYALLEGVAEGSRTQVAVAAFLLVVMAGLPALIRGGGRRVLKRAGSRPIESNQTSRVPEGLLRRSKAVTALRQGLACLAMIVIALAMVFGSLPRRWAPLTALPLADDGALVGVPGGEGGHLVLWGVLGQGLGESLVLVVAAAVGAAVLVAVLLLVPRFVFGSAPTAGRRLYDLGAGLATWPVYLLAMLLFPLLPEGQAPVILGMSGLGAVVLLPGLANWSYRLETSGSLIAAEASGAGRYRRVASRFLPRLGMECGRRFSVVAVTLFWIHLAIAYLGWGSGRPNQPGALLRIAIERAALEEGMLWHCLAAIQMTALILQVPSMIFRHRPFECDPRERLSLLA